MPRLERVRKLPAVAAVTALAALALAGCSAADTRTPAQVAGCERPVVGDTALSERITVAGGADAAPRVDMYTPVNISETQTWDITTGEGAVITTGDQLVVLDISLLNGKDGEELAQTAFDGDLTRVAPLSEWMRIPAFDEALHCAAEGSRVVVALGSDDIDPAVAGAFGITGSAVAVVDVQKVYLAKADGDDQFVASRGMPTVVRGANGQPGIMIPDAAAPTETVVEVLKKGRGEVVTGDSPVRVHYTGVLWDNPTPGTSQTPFDSSWGGTPVSFSLDQVVPGFAKALEGQTVGSQVLVVMTPEDGYGDTDRPGIPAGSTLVFVIDVLGIDAPGAR